MTFPVAKRLSEGQKRAFVDVDETICFYESPEKRSYDLAMPNYHNIAKINKLYEDGWHIIYWTARGSVSGIDYGEFTIAQLESWGCRWHNLVCGKQKGHFDLLIDDKAIRIEELNDDGTITDYKDLLIKYLTLVTNREGVTFCQYNNGELTKKEIELIEKLVPEYI